jgi:hypothetical protein
VRLLLDRRGQLLTYDQEVAKLRLIVETAAETWG